MNILKPAKVHNNLNIKKMKTKQERIIEILKNHYPASIQTHSKVADAILALEPDGEQKERESAEEILESIKNQIAEFSDKTFGSERPFTAPLHHLHKEVDEAIESGEIEEFVDMLLLLLDAYRKRFPDFTTETLLKCCQEKIPNLYNRKYGKPDENGVVEHIRENKKPESAEYIFNTLFTGLNGEKGCYHFPELKKWVLFCMEQYSQSRQPEISDACNNWVPDKSTSATRCKNCGKDRWQHPL